MSDLDTSEVVSTCCSAKVWNPGDQDTGICEACKEPCGEVELKEDEDE